MEHNRSEGRKQFYACSNEDTAFPQVILYLLFSLNRNVQPNSLGHPMACNAHSNHLLDSQQSRNGLGKFMWSDPKET